ncbi:MAG: hypothetical protein CL677_07395 [Bdellovibrionaceae bacterium]|nr:hypothetical protein [Pseudobdellovibrionaceae bacterium]|tara:strand:+ start:60672 stop:61736 length:1065 start_codon:yes stop_codon:yes gene_type:complete
MWRFANPWAFHFLWLIPILIILYYWYAKRTAKTLANAFNTKVMGFVFSSVSPVKKKIKLTLVCLSISFFVLALARPQSGTAKAKMKSEGIEVVLLLDVSESMNAEDIKPSRLAYMKKEMERFVDEAVGDRIGIVAFAGSAVLLTPVTQDKNALRMYIETLSTESVSSQGTDFGKALQEAVDAFQRGGIEDSEESVVTRAIVIASDGEDNEEKGLVAAEEIAKKGIRIFTMGFGTEKGGFIPIRDEAGQLLGYKKDRSDNPVLTATKGTVLKELASKGEGAFYHNTFGSGAVKNVVRDLKQLEQTRFEEASVVDYDEHYQIFLLLGFLCALAELWMGERKSAGRIWKGRFEVSAR